LYPPSLPIREIVTSKYGGQFPERNSGQKIQKIEIKIFPDFLIIENDGDFKLKNFCVF
jgi:hypothetical protein